MSGTIGGATYVLQFSNTAVVQGMAQTQQQIAASSQQIVASLNQIANSLSQTSQQTQQTSQGLIATALNFVKFSAEIQLAHMAVQAFFDALKFLKDGMLGFNDELAKSHLTWETFTKDTKAADAEVQALFEFSRKTPFTFQQVDEAARQLAAFGGVAFASQENLTLLGNVAAGTQKPLQTVTYEFGQMYQEIENGQPFGRAARALVQFGALTAETRTHLENMQKAGASTDDMLKVFIGDFDRFNGLIEKQATQTLSGSMSTLKDTVQSLIAISTKPFFDEILSGINAVNQGIEGNTALHVANTFKKLFQDIIDLFIIFIDSLKVDVASIIGVFRVMEIGVVEGVAGVLDALSKLPGGDRFKAPAANLHEYADTLRSSLLDLAKGIGEDGKAITDAWDRANDPNWRASGENAAKAFLGGFNTKFQAGDEDLVVDAHEYLDTITASFKGATAQQIGVFDNTADFIKTILLGSKSKGDPDNIMADIRPLIMDAIKGLHDDVNMGLEELKRVLPPEVYTQVEAYINALRDAENATQGLTIATNALNTAQANYDKVMADGKAARDQANKDLQAAQDQMTQNMAGFEDSIKTQESILASLRQDAEDAAQYEQGLIKAAQDDLRSLQEQVRQHAEEDKKREEDQQKVLDERQKIAKEHEDAFTAILNGETERFLRQHDAIDATTQAIIDRYNAEVEGKVRAAAGDDERVTRLEREERAKLLELDTRIRQERAAGHFAEADALQKQRDRVAAGYDDQIKYASQVAAVSKDKADEVKERIQKAADDSKDKDQKDVDAAQKTLDNIKEEGKARAAVDAEAIRQAQARVQATQDEAQRVANDYKDREQAIQQNITSIKAQQETARVRDQAAIDDAKKVKEAVDAQWTQAEKDAKDTLTHAQDTVTAAKDTKKAADDSLTSLQAVTKEWQKQYDYALGILNAQRALRDLPAVKFIPIEGTPGSSSPIMPTGNSPYDEPHTGSPADAPTTPKAAGSGAAGNVNNNKPSDLPPAGSGPDRSHPHFITPSAPGFVPTQEQPYPDGTWWDPKNGFLPDGYELRNGDYLYWVGMPGSSPTPSSTAPNFWGGGNGPTAKVSMSAMLAGQMPTPIAPPRVSSGVYGVSDPGGATAHPGYGVKELHVPLTFPNMTVDSPQRATEVAGMAVAGVRQALLDAHSRGVASRVGRKI